MYVLFVQIMSRESDGCETTIDLFGTEETREKAKQLIAELTDDSLRIDHSDRNPRGGGRGEENYGRDDTFGMDRSQGRGIGGGGGGRGGGGGGRWGNGDDDRPQEDKTSIFVDNQYVGRIIGNDVQYEN